MGEFLSLRGGLILFLVGAFIFLTLKKPKYGMIAYMILTFSRDTFLNTWFPPIYDILHLPQQFVILTFVSWLFRREFSPRFPSHFWLMLMLFGTICLSRFSVGTGVFSHKVPNEFFKMCILSFLMINTIEREQDLREVIFCLIAINTFAFLYHYYHYKMGSSWRSIFVNSIVMNLNRNMFAGTLASLFPLAYVTFFKTIKNKIGKIFIGFSVLSFVMGTILTYSRSAALSLGIGLIASVIFDKRKLLVIPLILISGLAIGSRLSENYVDRLETIKTYEEDASSMGRVATNHAAINMFKAHPLTGIGAGNFNDFFLDYMPEDLLKWVASGKSLHNVTLQIMAETGVIGLFIFSLLLMKAFMDMMYLRKHCLQHKSLQILGYNATGLGISLFSILVHLQFHPGAYYSLIYVFTPLIAAAKEIYKQHERGDMEVDLSDSEPEKHSQNQRAPFFNIIPNLIMKQQVKRSIRKFYKNSKALENINDKDG